MGQVLVKQRRQFVHHCPDAHARFRHVAWRIERSYVQSQPAQADANEKRRRS